MDKIAVIDMGGQYCHLIARRVRDLNVFSEILPPESRPEDLIDYKGIILSGGPGSVYDENAPKINKDILKTGKPVLGLCYGHQIIASVLGGKVEGSQNKEYGKTTLNIHDKKGIFEGLSDNETVWMSHGDVVESVPEGFQTIGSTDNSVNAAFSNTEGTVIGLQFHVEVTHTSHGMKMLDNFLKICKASRDWKIKDFAKAKIKEVKEEAGDKNVFLLVSGGVDSTVCFALLNKALGEDRVIGLHIDHGLERLNEAREVQATLKELGFKNFIVEDATQQFLSSLKEVYDPEEKRSIIGDTFIKVQQKCTEGLKLDPDTWLLGQGTIYPDTIETGGTSNAALIKTHHNRVPVVQKLIYEGKVIEPIKELYKDEVRKLGAELGLPDSIVGRHPFPGPGLGVRILCAQERAEISGVADNKLMEIAGNAGYKSHILPIKSVGVQGDYRTYRLPAALAGEFNWKKLEDVTTLITNSISSINRVIYSITHQEPTEFSFKPGYLSQERIRLLQEADDIVMRMLRENKLYDKIWQFPVVLLPISLKGGESIALRPVDSTEAMTASFYQIEIKIVKKIAESIMNIDGIDAVFYDITNKPPGTIEWE